MSLSIVETVAALVFQFRFRESHSTWIRDQIHGIANREPIEIDLEGQKARSTVVLDMTQTVDSV